MIYESIRLLGVTLRFIVMLAVAATVLLPIQLLADGASTDRVIAGSIIPLVLIYGELSKGRFFSK